MKESPETSDLEEFNISPETGFLSDHPPTTPQDATDSLQRLEQLGSNIPTLLDTDQLGSKLQGLEIPAQTEIDYLSNSGLIRLYTVSGFLANAYINKIDVASRDTIPSGLAVPLYEAANRLGRTPVLSYDAYVLHNWRQIDSYLGWRPHNIEAITKFADLRDERWFIAIHVAIESAAAPALIAVGKAQEGIKENEPQKVHRSLRAIEESLTEICSLLERMGEHNHPEKYGHGFRPYLSALTKVKFEGVPELDGPQSFRGASGAQSSIFPALDAAIGIDHGDNPLTHHLWTLRNDMPPSHLAFIEAATDGPNIKDFAKDSDGDEIQEAFNECIDHMIQFRDYHQDVVQTYLAAELGETEGTGGTPFGEFLTMFTQNTREVKIST